MLRPSLSLRTGAGLAAGIAAIALCTGCGAHEATSAATTSGPGTASSATTGTTAATPTTPASPTSPASPQTSPTGATSPTSTPTPLPAPVRNGPLLVRPAGGRATTTRARYAWVIEGTPAEQYTITVLQGLSQSDAVRTLGRIHERLDNLTGLGALQYVEARSASQPVPCVVQAGRIGATTVLYQPDGSLAKRHIEALSDDGMAAYFSTDENWDTRIQVASKGRVIRTLDPFATYTNAHDALPQEHGLRIGQGPPFAVSWALLERVSLTRITQNWLMNTAHPTYVVDAEHC